jgi:hypothetical protein
LRGARDHVRHVDAGDILADITKLLWSLEPDGALRRHLEITGRGNELPVAELSTVGAVYDDMVPCLHLRDRYVPLFRRGRLEQCPAGGARLAQRRIEIPDAPGAVGIL